MKDNFTSIQYLPFTALNYKNFPQYCIASFHFIPLSYAFIHKKYGVQPLHPCNKTRIRKT